MVSSHTESVSQFWNICHRDFCLHTSRIEVKWNLVYRACSQHLKIELNGIYLSSISNIPLILAWFQTSASMPMSQGLQVLELVLFWKYNQANWSFVGRDLEWRSHLSGPELAKWRRTVTNLIEAAIKVIVNGLRERRTLKSNTFFQSTWNAKPSAPNANS